MTATYDLIASNVLTSNVSSVTFSSLPSTYRDLVLVIRSNTSNNGNPRIRFNSDTGSNYSQVRMTGAASGTGSGVNANISGIFAGDFAYAGSTSCYIVQIMDYSASDKHKAVLSRANETAGGVEAISARWANTAAVTTLTIDELSGGTFSSGGTFYLYGIVS